MTGSVYFTRYFLYVHICGQPLTKMAAKLVAKTMKRNNWKSRKTRENKEDGEQKLRRIWCIFWRHTCHFNRGFVAIVVKIALFGEGDPSLYINTIVSLAIIQRKRKGNN